MQFKPELAKKILMGQKTQTRRIVKPGERFVDYLPGGGKVVFTERRTKWAVGQTYAIQPGRGKAAHGRFKLLDIRRELVKEISESDAIAEGFNSVREFLAAFESINGKEALDKEVWVLTFEIVK